MAPDTKSESDDDEQHRLTAGSDSAEAALRARLHRKRTKTGCLTCRKRRIKCGEERPVCRNCIKSKRHCDGYAQRVIFKPPTFDYRALGHGGAHITFQAGPVPGPTAPYHTEYMQPLGNQGVQSHLQPRPVEQFVAQAPQFHPHYPPSQHPDQQYAPHQYVELPQHSATPSLAPHAPLHLPHMQAPPPVQFQNPHDGAHFQQLQPSAPPYNMLSAQAFYAAQPSVDQMSATKPPPVTRDPYVSANGSNVQWISEHPEGPRDVKSARHHNGLPVLPATLQTPQLDTRQLPVTTASYVPRPGLAQPIDQHFPQIAADHGFAHPHVSMAPISQPILQSPPEYYEYKTHLPPSQSPTHVLNQAAVESFDDDYYDVHSDEEMDVDTDSIVAMNHDRHRTLGRMLHRNDINVQEMQMRRYDTFLYHGMLDHYRVEGHANPLRNPATARVFAHFISVTGPSLSIFERHPRNTSVLFTQGHIPFSQQGLWTYTMPMAALHHQGLLHAMLALASLHIARLNNASHTPSIQHYAWALRRIHQCVGKAKKRLRITTIATTMLLGFYEIMTADHVKWNMHLMGARQLFVETDFVAMAQQFRRMKLESRSRQAFGRRRRSNSQPTYTKDDLLEQIPDVDERIISDLVGREVRYGDHGQVMTPSSSVPAELDLSKYEILKDLYWWYCKQDAYQSIVSGNALLMDFSRWANCPPRAPLNKPDAVYGTFDHLMLLLARIADFSSRDRERKLRQIELNGGQWKPAPGMQMPTPPRPHANAPPTPMSADGGPPVHGQSGFPGQAQPISPPPMFFGMAPPPRHNVQMPSSYGPLNGHTNGLSTPQSAAPHEPLEIQIATHAALEEYGQIRTALFRFASSLGEAFQPLSFGEYEPKESAFGPAIFYRSYDIGTMWAVYNMAEIIAIRSHPHNPPAAHMAAGIAARDTAPYAMQIGRIAAGIVPGPPDQPLNPSLGAALCESCMPSFFAAVQYQDPQQRSETVERIYSVAERTGWGSAELIANGCETAWVKAAAMGRGPPYQRTKRREKSDDPRVNGSWENLDPNAMPDENNDQDRRLIKTKAPARLNWAIGIVGTEDDMDMSK